MAQVVTITMNDLKKPKRSLKELLPPDSISGIPQLFGVHGTNGETAKEICNGGFGGDGLREAAKKLRGFNDRFYFYTSSGRGFDFSDEWDQVVRISEIRQSIIGATKATYWYSRFNLKGWLEHEKNIRGFGAVVFDFTQEAYSRLKDDETIEIKGDPRRGPFPKYLLDDNFAHEGIRAMGAVVTDTEISKALSVIDPDFLLEGLDYYVERKMRQKASGEFVPDRMFETLERLGVEFTQRITDILTGRF